MQFIIIAEDYQDDKCINRRMSVRPMHLENIKTVKENGSVISAGGMTDENGKVKGSFLVLDFPSRKELDEYLEREPYIKNKVWETVRVENVNVVIVNDEKVGK